MTTDNAPQIPKDLRKFYESVQWAVGKKIGAMPAPPEMLGNLIERIAKAEAALAEARVENERLQKIEAKWKEGEEFLFAVGQITCRNGKQHERKEVDKGGVTVVVDVIDDCLYCVIEALEATLARVSAKVTVRELKRYGVQGLCAVSTVSAVNALIAARIAPPQPGCKA